MSNHAGENTSPIYEETVEAQGFDPADQAAGTRAALALPEAPPAAKAAPKPRPAKQPRNG